jgi:hypothetical protein
MKGIVRPDNGPSAGVQLLTRGEGRANQCNCHLYLGVFRFAATAG